jgi:hypothetical protein
MANCRKLSFTSSHPMGRVAGFGVACHLFSLHSDGGADETQATPPTSSTFSRFCLHGSGRSPSWKPVAATLPCQVPVPLPSRPKIWSRRCPRVAVARSSSRWGPLRRPPRALVRGPSLCWKRPGALSFYCWSAAPFSAQKGVIGRGDVRGPTT